MSYKKPKILVYDIETTPVLAWVWSCGKQYVNHKQLHKEYNETKIICITYQWAHHKRAKALVFDIDKMCDKEIVQKFDKIIEKADIVIGKNNNRFDDKHINYRRFRNGLKPMPEWTRRTDDLEKQMRKHFNMQSYSLDYFADQELGDGKINMCLDDWIQIVQYKNKSRLKKMVKYGKKDTEDTTKLILKIQSYVTPKLNRAALQGDHRCTNCGSIYIKRNGTRLIGNVRKQQWHCNAHGGFAGYTTILKNGKDGKITS